MNFSHHNGDDMGDMGDVGQQHAFLSHQYEMNQFTLSHHNKIQNPSPYSNNNSVDYNNTSPSPFYSHTPSPTYATHHHNRSASSLSTSYDQCISPTASTNSQVIYYTGTQPHNNSHHDQSSHNIRSPHHQQPPPSSSSIMNNNNNNNNNNTRPQRCNGNEPIDYPLRNQHMMEWLISTGRSNWLIAFKSLTGPDEYTSVLRNLDYYDLVDIFEHLAPTTTADDLAALFGNLTI